jgi:hypothetical protein
MVVSLRYHMTRHLLSIPGVLLRRETSRDAELPVHVTSSCAAVAG